MVLHPLFGVLPLLLWLPTMKWSCGQAKVVIWPELSHLKHLLVEKFNMASKA